MRYAKLENSPRLQRTLKALETGKELSTRTLAFMADICAVNSAIAELRCNGINIKCRTANRIYYYRIVQ